MKIRVIKTPPIDPIHGVEEGQEYEAEQLENCRANVQIVARGSLKLVQLEPWEWEKI